MIYIYSIYILFDRYIDIVSDSYSYIIGMYKSTNITEGGLYLSEV